MLLAVSLNPRLNRRWRQNLGTRERLRHGTTVSTNISRIRSKRCQTLRKRLGFFSLSFKKKAYTSSPQRGTTWQPETHNKDCNCRDSHSFTLSSLLSSGPCPGVPCAAPPPPAPPRHHAAVPVERLMRGHNALHCAPPRLALPFTRNISSNTDIFLSRLLLL